MGIASELGVQVSQDSALEDVIYAIIDKAAENSAVADDAPKRKRTRIAKKDTSKVYTVKGTDGENLDSKSNRTKKAEPASLFSDEPIAAPEPEEAAEPAPEEAAPKRRGRKPKAVVEAEAAAEAAEATETVPEVPEAVAEEQEIVDVPEAQDFMSADAEDTGVDADIVAKLREKMSTHKEQQAELSDEVDEEGVWMGDPGDGTDFITVVDIPIEDQEALPTLDMFDRPVVQQEMEASVVRNTEVPRYDFADLITANGVLECLSDGYGFLRSSDYNYLSSPDDVYVSPQQIKKYGLKTGDVVECTVRPPHDNEKYFALSTVKAINGREPSEVRDRVAFEHLTPLFPEEKFILCGDRATTNPSVRIVDLFSPIGKGQRA